MIGQYPFSFDYVLCRLRIVLLVNNNQIVDVSRARAVLGIAFPNLRNEISTWRPSSWAFLRREVTALMLQMRDKMTEIDKQSKRKQDDSR